jgi:phosphate transport system substrate-binding protein
VLTNQPGEASWPVTGASFILLHAKQDKPEAAREVLKFFAWSFKYGQDMAKGLDYVPMPNPVVQQIQATWEDVKDTSGKPVI